MMVNTVTEPEAAFTHYKTDPKFRREPEILFIEYTGQAVPAGSAVRGTREKTVVAPLHHRQKQLGQAL